MNVVQQLHREAMNFAEEAALEQSMGNSERARILYAAAFEKERQAAESLAPRFEVEPTRSVLFRSAASLAMDCGEVRSAERLIAQALIGNPPLEIAEELRDLLENVYFHRHLQVRGVTLDPHEFQISVAGGKNVGFGIVNSESFIGRVQGVKRLVFRTAERKAKKPFRKTGRPDSDITRQFESYLGVPRASSFAVTFRMGYSTQLHLTELGPDPVESVIAELLDCLDALEHSAPGRIETLIPDEEYRSNFVALARQIAPDGDNVKMVGFTASTGKNERHVALSRTASQIIDPGHPKQSPDGGRDVVVEGTLKFANALVERHLIKVLDENNQQHHIIVPEPYMDDIVRPLWDCKVRVEGVRQGREILLQNIVPIISSGEGS